TPTLPSHIKHSQWEYHYAQFHHGRRVSSRIQSWIRGKLELAVMPLVQLGSHCRKTIAYHRRKAMSLAKQRTIKAEQTTIKGVKVIVRVTLDSYIRPALRRLFGLEIVKSKALMDVWLRSEEATRLRMELDDLKRQIRFSKVEIEQCRDEQGGAFQAVTSQMHNL